ncbi:hypothetical protein ONZ45_g3590 [Pleurotus djamor]|nr:hypothetical protein ONZ45_g3590 [Pleurotus djamor]
MTAPAANATIALPPQNVPSVDALPPTTSAVNSNLLSGFFGDNPYFQAGFGLMGVGVALSTLRQGLMVGSVFLRRRLLVSVEINNKDRAYEWFLAWMSHRASTAAPQGRTSRLLSRSHQLSVETTIENRKNGSSSAMFSLVAGPGTHWFSYNGAWMQVKRERETRSQQLMSGMPWETITLTTLSKDRDLFPRLLAEARDLAMRGHEGKLVIHTAWGIEWKPFGQPRSKRPLHSVVLHPGISIPYRRGYLLHGPPGSGKTSFIQSLAGSLSYDICLLNLSERGLTDDKLNHLLSNAPERSFILVEDIDAAFNKRVQTSEDGYQSAVTFSGFLNALDGVASGEERIVFMTTNHIEKLDPALIRPGRVDLTQLVDDASPIQARSLFSQFYGGDETTANELDNLANDLENLIRTNMDEGRRISMAALQGIFIRSNSAEAIRVCKSFFNEAACLAKA